VTRHPWTVYCLDELVVGDEWVSPRRTVTETDVVVFAGLSGDFNPLHMDHSSQQGNAFGRPVAHGLLGLAIATGLMSQAPRVDTIAFSQSSNGSSIDRFCLATRSTPCRRSRLWSLAPAAGEAS
jgi:acyl dehydratase